MSSPATSSPATSSPATSSPLVADVAPVPSVVVVTPIAGVNQVTVTANGSVGVTAYVDLIPQVSGRIAQLAPSLAVGGRFRAGETLAVIEQDEFLLKLQQAAADVKVQRANLQLQRAKSDAAMQNYALINPNKNVPALVALGPQIAQAQAQLQAAKSREDIPKSPDRLWSRFKIRKIRSLLAHSQLISAFSRLDWLIDPVHWPIYSALSLFWVQLSRAMACPLC